jgi:peptide/nickel transport system ATP-binding protein
MPVTAPVLEVAGLSLGFRQDGRMLGVLDGISFRAEAGKTLAIVGESGCGKSVASLAIMGLLPDNAQVSGSARLMGRDLLGMSAEERRALRGAEMAMIFQEPMTSLNPAFTAGEQVAEALRLHQRLDRDAAFKAAIAMLEKVRIPDAARRARQYPHQLSGGMRQRVMIAIALACRPKLLIADEPTTALDVTIQAQILDLMRDLKHRVGAAIVLITHDLGVVAEVAERVVVMYAGRKVEEAKVGPLFRTPRHPYTQGLLGSVPKLGSSLDGTETRLQEIPGLVPSLKQKLQGCVFASRCSYATDLCRSVAPGLEEKAPGHIVACHYALKEAAAA